MGAVDRLRSWGQYSGIKGSARRKPFAQKTARMPRKDAQKINYWTKPYRTARRVPLFSDRGKKKKAPGEQMGQKRAASNYVRCHWRLASARNETALATCQCHPSRAPPLVISSPTRRADVWPPAAKRLTCGRLNRRPTACRALVSHARSGDGARSKTDLAMKNEVLAKYECHNICCLIQAMHEFGIDPVFG